MTWRRTTAVAAVAVLLALVGSGCEAADAEKPEPIRAVVAQSTPKPEVTAPVVAPAAPAPARTRAPRPAVAPLLYAAAGGDGDSWKDTSGREYRLGLVNTPETNECFGSAATEKRKQLVAKGFRARVYETDAYGRSVSVVTLPDGRNLNVWLARNGYANDKYLAQFRSENPVLATALDAAFAAAKAERLGLWGACSKPATKAPLPVAPQPLVSSCHPDYKTCVPVSSSDLDCPDIGKVVYLRQIGVDPYRLDADDDGIGCESYG